MCRLDDRLEKALKERSNQGNLRSLTINEGLIDFVSNDYLGLSRDHTLFELISLKLEEIVQENKNGAGGSRLLSGNSKYYEETESFLASIFQGESALIFNSGYQANLGLLSSIPQKGDTILYDQLSHICLKEGAWLSKAESVMFAHNDLEDLERRLKLATGEKFIVLESVYSMDGDFAPLREMVELSKKYDANIILDEAHSTGVMGSKGSGMAVQLGLSNDIFARVYTFGKGMGIHGACVVGSAQLKEYLINFGRPFIYTTALPLHSVVSINQAFQYLERHEVLQDKLQSRINYFKEICEENIPKSLGVTYPGSDTAIQPIIIPGNERIRKVSEELNKQGFDVRPILSPTVKSGTERLRICLHTYNTEEQIDKLLQALVLKLD
ncbi:MAG: 8-amino-7-oxononanoate synthase [bacterium]|nr:8-amino-7-oxononanoate synthase [bacterium]